MIFNPMILNSPTPSYQNYIELDLGIPYRMRIEKGLLDLAPTNYGICDFTWVGIVSMHRYLDDIWFSGM